MACKHYPLILCYVCSFFSVQYWNACEETENGILFFFVTYLCEISICIYVHMHICFLLFILPGTYAQQNTQKKIQKILLSISAVLMSMSFTACLSVVSHVHLWKEQWNTNDSLPFVGFSCALVERTVEHNIKEQLLYGSSKGMHG